jgi:hypothetical protein
MNFRVVTLNLFPTCPVGVSYPFFTGFECWYCCVFPLKFGIAVYYFKIVFCKYPELVARSNVGETHVWPVPNQFSL